MKRTLKALYAVPPDTRSVSLRDGAFATIRPFAEADYPAIAAIYDAAYPEYPHTVAQQRYWDEHRDPKTRHARWVAEVDGRVVAVGQYSQRPGMYHPRRFNLELAVLPAFEGRGIGSLLFERVSGALAEMDALSLMASAREDMTRSLRFLANRRFVETLRFWESRLDVTAFDFAPDDGIEEKVRAQRIEIRDLNALRGDLSHERRLWELADELECDVPHPEPVTPLSFEFFMDISLRQPTLIPETYLVAVDTATGEYVGTSNLWRAEGGDFIVTGLTGVKRACRLRGIALAMKIRGIRWVAAHGFREIRTDNESLNRPMLSINERLGFVKRPAWIAFTRTFREE